MLYWSSAPMQSSSSAAAAAPCLNNSTNSLFLGGRFIAKWSPLKHVFVSQLLALPLDGNQKERGGGLGHAVLSALESSKTPPEKMSGKLRTNNRTSNTGERKSRRQQRGGEESGELRGSDILLAIERASFKKIEKKKILKKEKPYEISETDNDEDEDIGDFSSVRILNIRSDWSSRIVDLEKRLQDLINVSSSTT